MTTTLAPERYLHLLDVDSARLAEVAAMGVDADVPSCPEWKVSDLLHHTAVVYLHKVEALRTARRPDPWPPPGLDERDPQELFAEARQALLAELADKRVDQPSWTWWPGDQTAGFWYRRMAQETVIHRVDAELSHNAVTPVDADLAVDGVDEVLTLMLGGPWYEPDETPEQWKVQVTTGGHGWTTRLDHGVVTVTSAAGDGVDAQISGEPGDMLLWLWGRGPLEPLQVSGDPDAPAELRRWLAMTTD